MLNLYNLKNNNEEAENSGDKETPDIVDKKSKKSNFEQYTDPDSSLSSKGLKWGIWFTAHKIQFYKVTVTSLIIFSIVVWGFNIFKWGFYLWNLPEYKQTEQQLTNFTDYSKLNYNFTAKPLQIIGVQVFNSGVEKYDIISDISNPNKNFIAYFDFYFYLNGKQISSKQKAVLLPQQNRPVVYMGVESQSGLSTPNVIIENLQWKRISGHEISDVKKWQEYRLNFEMSNFSFYQSYSGEKDKPNANVISFSLINKSPFDYVEPEFIVSLYSGGSFVGVIPFKSNGIFRSLENRKIDLRSFAPNLSVDNVIVNPLINVYDKNVYRTPSKK
jgi:hypothetical protein